MVEKSPRGVIIEPGRPEGPLVISDVQAESVHLSWKPPLENGGGTILGYLIEAKDVLHMDIIKTYIWSEGEASDCLVSGLQTSHIYQFRVYAKNEVGRGEALLNKSLIRIKATTKKPPRTSKPVAEIIDDESVLLTWTIPEGSQDLNFIVERCDLTSDLWIQCNHGELARTSYLVVGLFPGKTYKFRVSCENLYGVGPPSEESDCVVLKGSGGEPPIITVHVADCFVKKDDPALFSCEYSGTQPITVNWSKDGIRVRDGNRASIATERTKSILTLEEVDSDDDEYSVQCDLRNSEGKASSRGKIIMLSPPKISCPSSYKEGLTYDEGDNLRLKVTFSGKPTPCLRWFFNDEEPIFDGKAEVSVASGFIEIRISNLHRKDAGTYKFVAENQAGEDSVDVQVTLTGPPCAPFGQPNLELLDEELATLTWDAPLEDGGSSVFNYVVEIRKPEDNEWQRFATVYDTSFQITDVTSLLKYFFRIRAVNIYGMSEPSQEIQLTTTVSCDDKVQKSSLFINGDKANRLNSTNKINELIGDSNKIFEMFKVGEARTEIENFDMMVGKLEVKDETKTPIESLDSSFKLHSINDKTDKLVTSEEINEKTVVDSNDVLDRSKVKDETKTSIESLDSSFELHSINDKTDKLVTSEEINEKTVVDSNDVLDRSKVKDETKTSIESLDSSFKLHSINNKTDKLVTSEEINEKTVVDSNDVLDRSNVKDETKTSIESLDSSFELHSIYDKMGDLDTFEEIIGKVAVGRNEMSDMSKEEYGNNTNFKSPYSNSELHSMTINGPSLGTVLEMKIENDISISKPKDFEMELPSELSVSEVRDTEIEFSSVVTVSKPDGIEMELQSGISVSKFEDIEKKLPLKVMYVATQTLISIPNFNHACSDVHDFDEVTHFAAEVMPQEEYGIQVIDYVFCYTTCWLVTCLEDLLFDNSVYLYPKFQFESSYVSNDCSLKIYDIDFEDITYFEDKVMPQKEHGIQVMDYTLFYATCWIVNPLEDIIFDNSLYLYPIFKFESSCVTNICYLKILETSLYDSCFEVYMNESIKDQAYFIGSSLSFASVTEQCAVIPFNFKPNYIFYAEVEIESSYQMAICLSQHPWIMESLLSFIPNIVYTVQPNVICELYECVIIFEPLPFDSENIFETNETIVRSNSITHIPEGFETLAGLKCIPMTSFKPALSVLPMSRTAQNDMDQRNVESVDLSKVEYDREMNLLLSHQSNNAIHHSELVEENSITPMYSCNKCGSTDICLCTLIKEATSQLYVPDSYETNVSVNRFTEDVLDSIKNNDIPEWLRFVCPYWSSKKEITDEVILEDNVTAYEETATDNEVGKIIFKDKSVQELLNLAEEVERSFTQKTEQIESLENILQEELSSLEKDLEVVHEIHRNFWNESSVAWVDDSVVDESAVVSRVCQADSFGEKDLIDFKNDIPRVNINEMKQEEYAPQVITHLHNRIVQCGCRTRLYCSISGNPDPQIVWMKNGKLLTQSSRYVCGNLVEFGLYIDIFNSKSSDTGEYTCIATNCHGSAQTQSYLRVLGLRENSPEEPKFLSSPEDVVAEEGKKVTLEWKIWGTPAPHVIWFKNAEKIETSLRIDTFSDHRGCCRLVLHDVTAEDNAIYSCYLENEAGSAVSTVLVSVPGGNSEEPLSINTILRDLPVTTDNYPVHSLEYYERFLENPLPSSKDTVAKVRPSRRRKCVSDPPVIPSIVSSGDSWVILTWSAPTRRERRCGGLLYRVEKRLVDGERWKEVGRTWNTIYTASGLKKGRSYVFRISAGSEGSWGPPAMLAQPVHCRGDHCAKVYHDQIY